MVDKTVEKLRAHLGTPINTECAVVYLLSGVRKLIERDGSPHGTSFALKMYCHWALHLNLDSPRTTQEFLDSVDKFVLKNVFPGNSPTWPAGYEDDGTFSFMDEHYLFREFVYLDNLRRDLKNFLSKYGLPVTLCDDDGTWFAFVAAYASVIEDGQLAIKGKANALKAISKVVFKKGGRPLIASPQMQFVIEWNVHFEDGRVAKFTGEANSNNRMMSHGIHLTGVSKYAASTAD